jgi:hypothetical protein
MAEESTLLEDQQTQTTETTKETKTESKTEGTGTSAAEYTPPGQWVAALKEEYRADKRLSGMKGPSDLYEAFVKHDKRLSDAIFIPGETATDADKAAYRKRLGVPDTPDGYEIPDEVNGVKFDPESKKAFTKLAHELNIPVATAKKIVEWRAGEDKKQIDSYTKAQAEAAAAVEKQKAEGKKALEAKWGTDYGKELKIAERGLQSLSPALREKYKAKGLYNDPDFILEMHERGSKLSEAETLRGEESTKKPKPSRLVEYIE